MLSLSCFRAVAGPWAWEIWGWEELGRNGAELERAGDERDWAQFELELELELE